MKYLLLLALALVARPVTSGSWFDPEEGTELTRTFVAVAEYELDSVTFALDGEVVHEVDDVELSTESLERIVVTDILLEVMDGRPTDLDRTFVELLQEGTETSEDEDRESTSISHLEGRSVRFLWDDGEEDWYAEASDDGDDLESDVLEWLAGDMDLLAFLPEDDVEEGDEWEIEADAYLALMWPGGLFGFFDDETETEADPNSRRVNQQLIENLDGEGSVVFEELDDGLALLTVELEVTSDAGFDVEVDEEVIDVQLEIERSITGEIYWSLEENRLMHASFEAEAERTRADTSSMETEEGEVELTQTLNYSGTITYEVEFEVE